VLENFLESNNSKYVPFLVSKLSKPPGDTYGVEHNIILGGSLFSSLANNDITKGKWGPKHHRHTFTKSVPTTQMAVGSHQRTGLAMVLNSNKPRNYIHAQ
jgi:hypothetical protein